MKDLAYVGEGQFLTGIPATDLTAADIAAIAEQRRTTAADLFKALVGSGLYSPKQPAKPAPAEI